MNKFSKYVGLDVHQETIAVAVADTAGEARYMGEIVNTPESISKLVVQLRRGAGRLSFCYEAGPCGYTICRQLRKLKQDCQVIAPSLIPKKPGERVKTDRRDSVSLARLHRAGELSPVWIPDEAQEALRDLTRAREDMKHLQRQAKQRLLSFLSRHGHRYTGRSRWTQAHWRWLEGIKFAGPEQQIVLQEYIDTVQACGRRVASLDREVETFYVDGPAAVERGAYAITSGVGDGRAGMHQAYIAMQCHSKRAAGYLCISVRDRDSVLLVKAKRQE